MQKTVEHAYIFPENDAEMVLAMMALHDESKEVMNIYQTTKVLGLAMVQANITSYATIKSA